MKVDIISDLLYIIYLDNKFISLNFKDKDSIEKYLKNLFLKLKKRFDKEITGFFEVNIYLGKDNTIFVINKEDLDYYEYFNNTIEMQVNIINDCKFLYEVDDIFLFDLYKNNDVYYYNDKYYLDINRLNNIPILEYTNLIYGDIVDNILKTGKKLEINV